MLTFRTIILRDQRILFLGGPRPEVEERIAKILRQSLTFGIYEAQHQDDREGFIHISRHYITDCKQDQLLAYVWMPRDRAV